MVQILPLSLVVLWTVGALGAEKHPLCEVHNENICGILFVNGVLHVYVHQKGKPSIELYKIPRENIRNLLGRILVNENVTKSNMLAEWGYDPAAENKIPINMFVLPGEGGNLTLHMLYEGNSKNAAAIMKEKGPVDSFSLNGSHNAIVASVDYKGIQFYRSSNSPNWVVRGYDYGQSRLWFGEAIHAVAIDKRKRLIFKASSLEPGEEFVAWKKINGFVNGLFVYLLVDDEIWVYVNPNEGESAPIELAFNYVSIKSGELFWCSKELPEIIIADIIPHIAESHMKGKISTIYTLFFLHFFAAIAMLAYIIYFVNAKQMNIQSVQSGNVLQFKSRSASVKTSKTQTV